MTPLILNPQQKALSALTTIQIAKPLNFQTKLFMKKYVLASTNSKKKFQSISLLEEFSDSDVSQKTDGAELITKLSDFAKKADLKIELVMHEHMNDPVLSIVRKVFQDNDKNK